jgi:hypothetical protein
MGFLEDSVLEWFRTDFDTTEPDQDGWRHSPRVGRRAYHWTLREEQRFTRRMKTVGIELEFESTCAGNCKDFKWCVRWNGNEAFPKPGEMTMEVLEEQELIAALRPPTLQSPCSAEELDVDRVLEANRFMRSLNPALPVKRPLKDTWSPIKAPVLPDTFSKDSLQLKLVMEVLHVARWEAKVCEGHFNEPKTLEVRRLRPVSPVTTSPEK